MSLPVQLGIAAAIAVFCPWVPTLVTGHRCASCDKQVYIALDASKERSVLKGPNRWGKRKGRWVVDHHVIDSSTSRQRNASLLTRTNQFVGGRHHLFPRQIRLYAISKAGWYPVSELACKPLVYDAVRRHPVFAPRRPMTAHREKRGEAV